MATLRVLSPSALALLSECEQKFLWAYRERLREPEGAAMDARAIGKAVHAGFAKLWSGSAMEAVQAAAAAGLSGAAHLFGNAERELRPVREGATVLGVEMELRGPTTHGILDALLSANGVTRIVEVKTTGALRPLWWAQWQHSEQIAHYLDLVEETLPLVTLGQLEVLLVGVSTKDFRVELGFFQYDEALRKEFREQRAEKQRRAQRLLEPGVEPLKNSGSCFKWGRQCEFWALCVEAPERREALLQRLLATKDLELRDG